MQIFNINDITLDIIKTHINNSKDLLIDSTNFNSIEQEKINDILKIYLEILGKDNIFDFVSYCYKELFMNALKANMKRIYFTKSNLNVNNPSDYKKGMKSFKNDTMSKIEEFVNEQRDMGYYVRSVISIKNDNFVISVINNIPILEDELAIINERKKLAREFRTIDEALSIILNNEEGAGLGIIISILMLKKLGLTIDSYKIESNEFETIASIIIPISLITEEHTEIINDLILQEINDIPHFPDNIMKLQDKLGNPNVDIKEISMIISKDPSLTGDILKFSNSAMLMLPRKVSSLLEAIKLIGLKGLRNIIYSYQTNKILSKRYDMNKMKYILDHSYRVAFIAFYLAKKNNMKEDLEDCYIGGILHDFGKIVLLGLNPSLINKINVVCHEKGIPIRIIEEITSGYNHSLIGGKLARKWNFPEKLINAIEFHHHPYHSDKKFRKFINCIHIADMIAHNEYKTDIMHKKIEKHILEEFKLEEFSVFENFVKSVNENFQKYV